MKSQKNAVIYCRVSSKGQELNGSGLSSQENACKRYCEQQGYNVVDIFRDTFTGGDLDRPGINNLFTFVDEAGQDKAINVFVAEDISRIARDYKVHIEITRGLLSRGVKCETVNMKFEDTPAGEMIEGIMAIYSQYFRQSNKQQVINRQEARLMDGYRPRDYPLGYVTKKAEGGGKILIKDEPNASIIKEALEGYANGLFQSVTEVAKFLERKGLDKTRSKSKSTSKKIHNSLVSRMLNKILYTGYIEYKHTSRDKDGVIKKVRDVPLRKGRHEGIISMETYEKIQEKLNNKRPYIHDTRKVHDEYPLRGHIVCECCSLPLTSGKSRSKSGKQIAYYQFNKKCTLGKGKSIQAVKLHQIMSSITKSISVSEKFISYIKILVSEEFESRKGDTKAKNKHIEKEINQLNREMNRLMDMITKTKSSVVIRKMEQKIEECDARITKLTEQLKNNTNGPSLLDTLDVATRVMTHPNSIWKEGDIEQKQMLLNLLFKKKIPVVFATRTYGTLPFHSFFTVSEDILDDELQHLKVRGVEPLSECHEY